MKCFVALTDLFSRTDFTRPMYNGEPVHLQAKDILGHVYEYFLGQFAPAEGKKVVNISRQNPLLP